MHRLYYMFSLYNMYRLYKYSMPATIISVVVETFHETYLQMFFSEFWS
jgi:hypothetical protein